MKKLFAFFVLSLLTVFLLAGCKAKTPALENYVFDTGDYLTAQEEQEIQNRILEVRDKAQSDLVVYFTDRPASDDYIKEAKRINNDFIGSGGGYGNDHHSVLFYVDMANRHFAVDQYSDGKGKLSSDDIDSIIGITAENETISGSVRDYMSQERYKTASLQFVNDAYKKMKPGFFGSIWGWLTSGLAGGGALSGILIGKHKRQPATPKTSYRKQNGTIPLRAQDHFVGTTREVRHIERQQPSDGGKSGENEVTHASSGSDGHTTGGASF